MRLTIGHLYPELLNLYGDRGNITALSRRAAWRGIDVTAIEYRLSDEIDFSALDIVFVGGGSDREQLLVCKRLGEIKARFQEYADGGGVVAAICGGYQLLGRYYKLKNETVEGLSVLDVFTESGEGRLIGDVVIQTDFLEQPVVGFENHGGRTYIGSHAPLGKVVSGGGNNGTDGAEGVRYKNIIATYLHGPLFPKNPHLCDYVLTKALEKKYGAVTLSPLNDDAEFAANRFIVNRFA
ncbi:MAG: glutamine amidotransferase [Clostridiales bacterium]|jgi:CobQ-like glutamine amidotransferase family enzyme|nr:glutamine amidotransferase [Clostridiales bacterium]